ncbi:hypothetical protein P308_17455 [Pseudomonas piscis]|nr:hypothetical protein P308_17455 [Pseudomonas piscis]
MHHPEASGVDEQRHPVEPLKEIVPVAGVLFELGQGLVDQPGMARGVLTHELLAAALGRRGAPAQGIELVVAHDAQRLAGLDHVVDDVQGLANPRAAIDDVAKEHRHA